MLRALTILVKMCITCHLDKDLNEFKQHSVYKDKKYYRNECNICLNKRHTSYRAQGRIFHPERELLNAARYRAKKNGIDFNLLIDDIFIPDICPVLEIAFFSKRGRLNDRGPCDNSPLLDRIDSNKGYIKGNCCVISHKANRMKQENTLEDLLKIVNYIKKFTNEWSIK